MDARQYETWKADEPSGEISLRPLDGGTKTLLWGIHLSGDRVHLFQHENAIHFVAYRSATAQEQASDGQPLVLIKARGGASLSSGLLSGNERWFPERCDFEFCRDVQSRGLRLPMMPYRGITPRDHLTSDTELAGWTNIPELDGVSPASPTL